MVSSLAFLRWLLLLVARGRLYYLPALCTDIRPGPWPWFGSECLEGLPLSELPVALTLPGWPAEFGFLLWCCRLCSFWPGRPQYVCMQLASLHLLRCSCSWFLVGGFPRFSPRGVVPFLLYTLYEGYTYYGFIQGILPPYPHRYSHQIIEFTTTARRNPSSGYVRPLLRTVHLKSRTLAILIALFLL